VHIPSNPEHVCRTHAVEFWTGLIAYVKDRTDPGEIQDTPCACEACNQLSAMNTRLTIVAAGGAVPQGAQRASGASSRRFTGRSPSFVAVASGDHAASASAQAADVPARSEGFPVRSSAATPDEFENQSEPATVTAVCSN
jgi:hypothetical protein